MPLEERCRRVSVDTLELVMTVTAPNYYAKPWKSQTKGFKADSAILTPIACSRAAPLEAGAAGMGRR